MTTAKRSIQSGHPYHITSRALAGLAFFSSDAERLFYVRVLWDQALRTGVNILSWCLMVNHEHLLVVAEDENALSEMLCQAHNLCARRVNRRLGRKGHVFEERFRSSHIPTEQYLFAVLRYIDQNPVRAGIVAAPWDYPWSSALFHAGLASTDPLVRTLAPFGLDIDWSELLRATPVGIEEIRNAARDNRPLGGLERNGDLTASDISPGPWPTHRTSAAD